MKPINNALRPPDAGTRGLAWCVLSSLADRLWRRIPAAWTITLPADLAVDKLAQIDDQALAGLGLCPEGVQLLRQQSARRQALQAVERCRTRLMFNLPI
jgi:hypothetical protein